MWSGRTGKPPLQLHCVHLQELLSVIAIDTVSMYACDNSRMRCAMHHSAYVCIIVLIYGTTDTSAVDNEVNSLGDSACPDAGTMI
jgi:hypothetical protein